MSSKRSRTSSAFACICTALLFAAGITACGPEQMGNEAAMVDGLPLVRQTPTDAPSPTAASGTQRHVVTFKYGVDVPAARIAAITERFVALRDSIPGIVGYEHGVNNSPEGLNKDITHAYLLTFRNAAARDAYLPHPAHQRFVELLDGAVEDVFVIDYLVEGP